MFLGYGAMFYHVMTSDLPAAGSKSSPFRGFTLIELLIVVGIIIVMMGLMAPAFNAIKGGGDVTKAAYDISSAIETARSHALANNTYTWVGFFEEDGSQRSTNPATPGVGRIVMCSFASKDGGKVYASVQSPAEIIDPTKLTTLNKLIRLDHVHLKTFTNGNGTGSTFATRPAASAGNARIGDADPPSASLTPLQYPVGTPKPVPQYTFTKALQFSPRGEVRINNDNYTIKRVAEIGIQPTHGAAVDANNQNVAVIQITGIAGNVKIYRR